ncbi:phage minor head protein [Flavobacterium sp. LB2P53]|uniref:phage head morphogenesis protein n=1 Tax=Flavobacterium sp. LB2P53 TaxID=2497481 RepID=UPI000F827240|nr:phage minor head protein [Flavobacterium sp. LB2P53]RTY71586.1 hypothetical protein EKL95_02465 [Flavobacterium sp. LB2P53]
MNLAINDSFKNLLNTGKTAFERLHEIGSYRPEDLQKEKAYKDLMNQTFDAFNFAITDNDMPEVMRNALQDNARLFGGLKTNAQLFEASKLLLDKNGNLKPFSQLSHEYDKLNITYNKNYLEAEYEFAVGSSQMATKWNEFGDNDRYELQYRTAGDNRVRAEHDALRDITLPKSDPFWNSYTPPNGWNCRCTVVEVLKDKYPTSDSEKAIASGEKATSQIGKDGKNRLEIFRFNPGAEKVVFPPAHPYGKVKGAKEVEKNIKINKKSFQITEDAIKDLRTRNIEIDYSSKGLDFFNSNFKGFDFSEFDNSMSQIAKDNKLVFSSKKISLQDDYFITTHRTDDGFYLSRKYYFKEGIKTVYHDYFKVPSSLQGNGISKKVFQSLYQQYKNAKIAQIEVFANIDIGGYTWGKYGFACNSATDMITIKRKAKRLYESGQLNEVQFKDFSTKTKKGSNGLYPMYKVAYTNYGKKVLLGENWHGILNLKSRVQRAIFEEYLLGK